MKLITSFGPSRIERQQKCVESWIRMGCDVVAVQSRGEAELFNTSFPNVQFVETDLVGDLFGRPKLVRIKAMMNLATDQNVMLINSDIEINMPESKFEFYRSEPAEKELKIGIRWDVDPKTGQKSLFKWGIDAFVITPQIASIMPDIGMSLGLPSWDYWIPWYLHRQGYKVTTNKDPGLFHEAHEKGWSNAEYQIGLKIFQDQYKVNARRLTTFIQVITKRTTTKNVRRRR